MKNKFKTRFLALALCVALLLSCFPLTAFADEVETTEVAMTEGDVIADFAPADTACTSSDPSVAWVDANGSLNALKEGTAIVTVPTEEGSTEYTVTVGDYTDGSEVVGNLKILARYNDSMQFYDGHAYLLFTSYQDGVNVTVNDLYGGYEVADKYYEDIREDIANGSNHTGNDADKYFTFNEDMKSVTLDRGEAVSIGMYRDFALSVPQAALGSIKNSSLWTSLSATAKSEIVKFIFNFLNTGNTSTEEAIANIKAVCTAEGVDYTKLLDGVVDGGVCFNRELYNQKLEWDQYENVSYELDITRNQLNTMTMYLHGNLNKFSIFKNSCATVALRAWNAAVGTRNGVPTAYALSAAGEGIFSMIDAPKGVRDSIVSRLPGYYLNNAEGVAEPDAGFEDETGWVYVSAPEKVTPVSYVYADDSVVVDDSKTKLSSLMNAAKAGQAISYDKDEQQIDVTVNKNSGAAYTTVSGIDFSVNGTSVSINKDNAPDGGIWFNAKVEAPADGEDYYVLGVNGKALPSEYADGVVTFCAESLPVTYKIVSSSESAQNVLKTTIVNGDKANVETEVYTKNGDETIALDSTAHVNVGTKIYIKSTFDEDEFDHLLYDVTLNGASVFDDEHYDAGEEAYFVIMPEKYSKLVITYEEATVVEKGKTYLQVPVGTKLDVTDYADLLIGDDKVSSDKLVWETTWADDEESCLENNGKQMTAVKEGRAYIFASAEDNMNISLWFSVEVYEDRSDMVAVTYNNESYFVLAGEEDEADQLPFSGYLVKKGTPLKIVPDLFGDTKAVAWVMVNGEYVKAGDPIIADKDTDIAVAFANATIENMPRTVKLADKDNTYQLEATVKYAGLTQIIPVYDSSIRYESSDSLVEVDENGLITVAGDIPEDGKVVYITAYAGSSNDMVFASTKVVVGDYKGDKVVGKLTIYARRAAEGQLVPHGSITFTPYEDIDLDVSYYHYYKPNDQYNDLMIDHADHPENYTSDPALCNNNELELEDRESYFDVYIGGIGSDPQTVSLKAGESISMSNYSYDTNNLYTIMKMLQNSTISQNAATQKLVEQMERYIAGEEFDGSAAFDGLLNTLVQIYMYTKMTGQNPADGHSDGGLDINREMYNQFRRNDSQTPNNYYTVEITADELAAMEKYISDPENNYYSLFVKNCASGSVDVWNAALFDRPELHLKGNYTGIAVDPESLYVEIGLLTLKEELDGEGGKNFYPRSVAYNDAVKDAIAKIDAIGDIEFTDGCKEKIDAAREAFDALTDVRQAQVYNADKLAEAEEAYAQMQLAADKEVFADYKDEQKAFADTLVKESDLKSKVFVSVAKALIDALQYDENKSLEENKATVDTIIALLQNALVEPEKETVILGDADGDGEVTVFDATMIQRTIASIGDLEINEAAADADEDGEVTVLDASYIQRWLSNIPSNDHIGKPIQ